MSYNHPHGCARNPIFSQSYLRRSFRNQHRLCVYNFSKYHTLSPHGLSFSCQPIWPVNLVLSVVISQSLWHFWFLVQPQALWASEFILKPISCFPLRCKLTLSRIVASLLLCYHSNKQLCNHNAGACVIK